MTLVEKKFKNIVSTRRYDTLQNALKHMDDVKNQTSHFCLIFAPQINN